MPDGKWLVCWAVDKARNAPYEQMSSLPFVCAVCSEVSCKCKESCFHREWFFLLLTIHLYLRLRESAHTLSRCSCLGMSEVMTTVASRSPSHCLHSFRQLSTSDVGHSTCCPIGLSEEGGGGGQQFDFMRHTMAIEISGVLGVGLFIIIVQIQVIVWSVLPSPAM